ncbi:hypothetical protein U9M48_001585 [Paspalum notatum var. saurae]|uniref:DUF659 domain-containing protein n=1 Tax=Paspalum notatum var. saurae TaxID=547442 RepID=A0AAQ3PF22_PASNO
MRPRYCLRRPAAAHGSHPQGSLSEAHNCCILCYPDTAKSHRIPYRIHIRYGYAGDTRRRHLQAVSPSPSKDPLRNSAPGAFRAQRIRPSPYPPLPVPEALPPTEASSGQRRLHSSARTRATQEGKGGRLPATSHRRRATTFTGDEQTRPLDSSRSSGPRRLAAGPAAKPTASRKLAAWRLTPICKIRAPYMASPNLSRASGSATAAPGSGSSTPSLSEQTETRTADIKAPLWIHVTVLEKAKAGGGNTERRHIESLLDSTKSTWPERGVTICSDGWSDPRRRPIINFIAVFEKASIFLRADNCEGQVKTKEYIAEKLRGIIEEVGRQNVVQIITDNAANCKGAGLLIEVEYDNIFWTPCVVHTLNLAMKSICEPKVPREPSDEDLFVWNQLEFMHNVKSDATMIKNFIMNHGMRLSMFNEFSHLKLLSIAETRFASVVCMLKRFVEIKTALQHMVISDKWSIYKDDAPTAQVVKEKILSDVWWGNVEYILRITNPIYEMIRLADTDTPCLHLIYEMWDSMIERVKKEIYLYEGKELDEVSDLYNVIHDILIARWTKGNNPLHCLAHSLNPRYYSKKWLKEGVGRVPPHKDNEVFKMRMTCFKKFFRIPQELAKVKEEYSRFSTCLEEFNDPDSIHDRWAVSPMTWWTNHGHSVPLLMGLAIKLLSQPASSSCCERNWSTYSFVHSVKKNALTPQRAEDLVFVHSNLRHLSRRSDAYKKGETTMWDVGGDSFDSLGGVGLLEVAELSLDEPELQAISFGMGYAEAKSVEESETIEEEQES